MPQADGAVEVDAAVVGTAVHHGLIHGLDRGAVRPGLQVVVEDSGNSTHGISGPGYLQWLGHGALRCALGRREGLALDTAPFTLARRRGVLVRLAARGDAL